jgi:hypothetical protein
LSSIEPTPWSIAAALGARPGINRSVCVSLILATLAVFAVQAPDASAKVVTLKASANLRITTTHGNDIEAEGTIAGTFAGSLSVHVTLSSGSRMTATFVGRSHAGKLAGSVSAEYYPSGSVNIYSGAARISSGTGSYAHASSDGVHVSGTMSRSRRLISMSISGRLSE